MTENQIQRKCVSIGNYYFYQLEHFPVDSITNMYNVDQLKFFLHNLCVSLKFVFCFDNSCILQYVY